MPPLARVSGGAPGRLAVGQGADLTRNEARSRVGAEPVRRELKGAVLVVREIDVGGGNRTCSGSTRAVMLLSWLGTAVMAAVAVPAAHVLAKQPDQVPELVEAFALFVPGIAAPL